MAILIPSHLLDQAEHLLKPRGSYSLIRQVDRRRAISAAYYAVFHKILISTADQFIGRAERKSTRYSLAYRNTDHKKLEELCKITSRNNIDDKNKYFKFIPNACFGENIREFSTLYLKLKENRNAADYDPSHRVKMLDAQTVINEARTAIAQFENAPVEEKIIFLTLLVFPPR